MMAVSTVQFQWVGKKFRPITKASATETPSCRAMRLWPDLQDGLAVGPMATTRAGGRYRVQTATRWATVTQNSATRATTASHQRAPELPVIPMAGTTRI